MTDQKDTHTRLDAALDEALLDLIANGRVVLDNEGRPVLDEDGQPLRRQPTAADLQAARARLKDLGITKTVTEGSDADRLAAALGLEADENPLENYRIPDLDLTADDAATAAG